MSIAIRKFVEAGKGTLNLVEIKDEFFVIEEHTIEIHYLGEKDYIIDHAGVGFSAVGSLADEDFMRTIKCFIPKSAMRKLGKIWSERDPVDMDDAKIEELLRG